MAVPDVVLKSRVPPIHRDFLWAARGEKTGLTHRAVCRQITS
jgi:hypothetical protein